MATIKDIAKKSGYSISTVSRVLNNQRNVDPKIQETIFACAKELGYKPNLLGQLLKKQNSRLIMCMIPNAGEGLMFEIFSEMHNLLDEKGYHLLLCPEDPESFNAESDPQIMSLLESGMVGGIIFSHSFLTADELNDLNSRHPLVQVQEYNEKAHTSVVSIDYFEAMNESFRLLIRNGHRRIGVLSFFPHLASTKEKLRGINYAMEKSGIKESPELMVTLRDTSSGSVETAVRKLMEQEERPTALLCFSDDIAIKAIKTIKGLGLRVPEDCSVFGFDNSYMSRIYEPGLSTVGVSAELLARKTVEVLLDQIEEEDNSNVKVLLPHTIVLRETLGSVPE